MTTKLALTVLSESVSICRLGADIAIPDWAHNAVFSSITRTAEELSIVCFAQAVPSHLQAERDWRVLKMEGPFELTLVGILAGVAEVLRTHGISLFVVSTFDTDYVLVKAENLEKTLAALTKHGYQINS